MVTGSRSDGGLRKAAEAGTDAVLLAVPYEAVVDVVGGLGEALRGKVLIDCTNPVGPGFRLLTEGGPSAAERIASAAPDAHVVKAFNLCHSDVWRLTPPVFDGRPLAVPLCGDDEGALSVVRRLVRDLGCEPLNAGGLDRAGLVEAISPPLAHSGVWSGPVSVPARRAQSTSTRFVVMESTPRAVRRRIERRVSGVQTEIR